MKQHSTSLPANHTLLVFSLVLFFFPTLFPPYLMLGQLKGKTEFEYDRLYRKLYLQRK